MQQNDSLAGGCWKGLFIGSGAMLLVSAAIFMGVRCESIDRQLDGKDVTAGAGSSAGASALASDGGGQSIS